MSLLFQADSPLSRSWLVFSLLASFLVLTPSAIGQASEREAFFESRIRPLLSSNCYTCHTDLQTSGLRLDSRESILKGGSRGPAIVSGRPEESLLIKAIIYTDETLKMPPPGKLAQQDIADLVKWVKEGAFWPEAPTELLAAVSESSEYLISPEQRAFWSFQPPAKHPVPDVKLKGWARNPIDNFILAKLEEKGLKPAPGADKRTLIRRASYDLIGLPPTPEETEAFLADPSPTAFAKLIDRLLASAHYGERWGRHWLDLVRYADSAGDSADYPVPQAYLYRNYVINSFNKDKPYDQFIREQIAGDLLPGQTEAQRWERVVATGYLAIARRFSVRPERNMHLTIEDTIDNVGKSFLGLSVRCARCHNHKYDPISSKDYYALYGVFDSTRYPFAGSENIQEQQDLISRLPQSKVDVILKPFRAELRALDEQMKELEEERKTALAQTGERPATARTPDEIKAEIKKLKKLRKPILAKMPDLEMTFAVAEGTPHNARVQIRGDPKKLGEEVPRRFLQILGGQDLPSWARGSGRLQLAEWLSDRQNPLTARVMVNRIWQHHFGKGIVATPSNFGRRGAAPTHPQLLDYLALQFIESGWSIKAMHRRIMLSQTYQLASNGDASNARADADNKLLWKFNRRRLDAEAIRDSLLMISGELDTTMGEAHSFPHQGTWGFTQHKPFVDVYETKRRSVYLMTQRIQKHPYLSIFDGADTNSSTAGRLVTTTPIQALFMMNSAFVHERADHLARGLIAEVPETPRRIDRAHRMALGRPARPEELRKAEHYLKQARKKLAAAGTPVSELYTQALASYLRALLSSNEFLFVD
ncbi:DUF1553 domain-containing protein [Acidobacteria bacterium AH-259-A15]|nr:DUF1553 domain-containing protein [Acidobacteria bacterium AH-259-A15]